LTYGSPSLLQVWLASTDTISDSHVFLVRSGFGAPAFARVCTEADLHNYPDSDLGTTGWYRVPGLTFELRSSETVGAILSMCQKGLDGLDQELTTELLSSVPTSDSVSTSVAEFIPIAPAVTITIPLHLYRTEAEIGTMTVVRSDLWECYAYTVSVDFGSTLVPEAIFKVTTDAFKELIGICTPDDLEDVSASTSGSVSEYDLVSEITVYLNKDKPELEGLLYGALATDIEDLYSFVATES
jgi:hypothetical protein